MQTFKLFVAFIVFSSVCFAASAHCETINGECAIGGRPVQFEPVQIEGAAGVAIAEIAPNLFGEFKDVYNEETLDIVYNDRVITSRSTLSGGTPSDLQVAAKVDGELVECHADQ
jgi:hypothetical protein